MAEDKQKLQEKGASETEARYAAEWMEAIGAINDGEYAAMLVRHYGQQGYGTAWVREKLWEKGVPRELWEDALEQLPPQEEQIEHILNSKLRGKCLDEGQRKRLSAALARRGFAWNDIRAALNRRGAELAEEDSFL